jgi:uncharacterized membrane protein YqhA
MKKILLLRVVLLPMIIFVFIISIVFMIRGIWITIDVLTKIIKGELHFVHYSEDKVDRAPSLMLLEGVDSFLLAFVFFVFSFGLYKIFFIKENKEIDNNLPRWLHIESIFELKSLLWYSVLTTMVVLFLNYAVVRISADNISWTFLMFPASILLISISLFFMKKAEK